MNETPRLYQLQVVDLELDEKRRQLQDAETKIGDSTTLQIVRDQGLAAEEYAKGLALRTRQAEKDLESQSAKVTGLQKRLFGGEIGKQKEATALENELQTLRADKARLEDQLFDLLAEADEQPAKLAEAHSAAQRAEQAWNEEQAGLTVDADRLRAEVARLEADRERLVGRVSPAKLRIYEDLRRTLRGRAVVRVERNTCLGCRVSLPMSEVQHARTSPDLSFCGFCGRIIHIER